MPAPYLRILCATILGQRSGPMPVLNTVFPRRYIMPAHESTRKELAEGVARFFGHATAIVVGLVLMFAGIAMGVSLVLLPVGIPVGLAGLFVFLWGLFGGSEEKKIPMEPQDPR
jgi:hypothetical protein